MHQVRGDLHHTWRVFSILMSTTTHLTNTATVNSAAVECARSKQTALFTREQPGGGGRTGVRGVITVCELMHRNANKFCGVPTASVAAASRGHSLREQQRDDVKWKMDVGQGRTATQPSH